MSVHAGPRGLCDKRVQSGTGGSRCGKVPQVGKVPKYVHQKSVRQVQ